jgi:molecular chaperone DnaK
MSFGIDLGTTNSCIARWEGAETRVFQNNDQMNVTPSAVYITRSGRVIVGRRALTSGELDVDNLATEFKRWMGQKELKHFTSGAPMLPEELSAEVLKSVLEDVRRQTGETIREAVVTVPAAFGTLQCDATARAARLAGLTNPLLLQEPIAAAVAYGARPDSRDERWLVFDLGGGTLDIAVVSTRDGHLNVLGHRGDNLLGGKDITRAIVTDIFIPRLTSEYKLPDIDSHPDLYRKLVRRLTAKAEEAKIDLSSANQTTVSLFEVGEDLRGTPIDYELTLSRADVERFVAVMMSKCIALIYEVLRDATVGPGEVSKTLLVGGPTQTPYVRSMLREKLGIDVDHSLDPMTIVARGAAIFASSQALKTSTASSASMPSTTSLASLKLAYDAVSASTQADVSGQVGRADVAQIRIDAESGFWSSGWFAVDSQDPFFEQTVHLRPNTTTKFWVYARRADGTLVELDGAEFEIRHGLVVGAPPLPHSISIEVRRPDGAAELDRVFERGTPLPAQRVVRYRADRTLRPTDAAAMLPIKLWEGECDADPQSNEWVGHMTIEGRRLKRPLPEGSEVELTIRIDASRLLTVDAYIPHLNEQFSEEIYVAQREERDLRQELLQLPQELATQFDRISELETQAVYADDTSLPKEVESLRRRAEDVDLRTSESIRRIEAEEADDVRRVFDESRAVRQRVAELEMRLGASIRVQSVRFQQQYEETRPIVEQYGDVSTKQEVERLREAGERALLREDVKSVDRAIAELRRVYWQTLFAQDWFWANLLADLKESRRTADIPLAVTLISQAEAAQSRGDTEAVRENVWQLWKLQRSVSGDDGRLRAAAAGLRRY